MATISVAGRFRAQPARPDFSTTLRALWTAYRSRRAERRARADIARLGPRLIRDIGYDPELVGAQPYGWDGALVVNRALLPSGARV